MSGTRYVIDVDNLRVLRDRAAAGDERSVRELLNCAEKLCSIVDEVTAHNIDVMRKEARTRTIWPSNAGCHPAAIDDLKGLLNALGLGRDHPEYAAMSGSSGIKRKRADSPRQAIAIDLWDMVARARHPSSKAQWAERFWALVPLNEVSFASWFDLAWRTYRDDVLGGNLMKDTRIVALCGGVGSKVQGGYKTHEGYARNRVEATARPIFIRNATRLHQ